MSANAIRRSDENVVERYKSFADKLEKIQEQVNRPKFYEYGKSVTYQESDAACLPIFTTNYINLSDISGVVPQKTMDKNASSQKDKSLQERASRRRVIAQLNDFEQSLHDFEPDDEEIIKMEECPKCGSKHIADIIHDESIFPIYLCEECGHKWRKDEEEDLVEDSIDHEHPFPFGREEEVFASIQSMLPEIIAKPNKKMNKMANNIVSGLINSLNIEDSKKRWFNAQVESGVLNSDVFMRNLKNSIKEK